MKELIVASHNQGKIEEIQEFLKELGIRVIGVGNLVDMSKVEETASTLEGNAKIKADYVFKKLSKPILSDDTGLFVRDLDGAPGVYTARFAGENASDKENRSKLLKELENSKDRFAFFETVLYLIDDKGISHVVNGVCEGTIAEEEIGDKGFGYDSIFIPLEEKKTFAQLSIKEKNAFSHRAKALKKLKELLVNIVDESRNNK
ncbi:RdgB/HAM1 family non-canonical purine NTP pyrophosphatase [Lagierella sp.]|uniref:RdgB/HAM1 family non-canonical purine NTP pyrophosphatase n=1 Tax=Lagierella sp. TaxID=2849657 RepID=UPI0026143453|nr:RdgB/HAM1 family non-canonical purine NTP pyrophosphatase [Lagierella sp.]